MAPVDAFWHVLNFFAPAFGVGMLTPLFAKLLWRRELADVRWALLSAWGIGSCCLVLLAGTLVFGRDGKMVTYMAMVAVCSMALWWIGFGRRRR